MKPKRILAVTETLGIGGGAEQILVSLVQTLHSQNILIDIACLQDWHHEIGNELEKLGVQIYKFHSKSKLQMAWATLKIILLLNRNS